MGSRFKFADALRLEESTAAFIPYSSQVTRSVVKLANGDYVQTLRLQGAAHESADVLDLNVWHDQLNGFLRNIASPNVAVWSHVVRREYGEFPAGDFAPGFCHDFNVKYRDRMASERMLVNELYLTLLYRPNVSRVSRLSA